MNNLEDLDPLSKGETKSSDFKEFVKDNDI